MPREDRREYRYFDSFPGTVWYDASERAGDTLLTHSLQAWAPLMKYKFGTGRDALGAVLQLFPWWVPGPVIHCTRVAPTVRNTGAFGIEQRSTSFTAALVTTGRASRFEVCSVGIDAMRAEYQRADYLQTWTRKAGAHARYKNVRAHALKACQYRPHFLRTQSSQRFTLYIFRLSSSPTNSWTPSPIYQPSSCLRTNPRFRWTRSTPVLEAGLTSTVSSPDA